MKFLPFCLLVVILLVPARSKGQNLKLTAVADLNFGEIVIPNATAGGFFEIDPQNSAPNSSNAFQIGTFNVGVFTLDGKEALPIVLTLTAGGFVCDTTYLNPCMGTPTLTLTSNFTGAISANNCIPRPHCKDDINVGGRFSFGPAVAGRWTNTITIVANYQ